MERISKPGILTLGLAFGSLSGFTLGVLLGRHVRHLISLLLRRRGRGEGNRRLKFELLLQ